MPSTRAVVRAQIRASRIALRGEAIVFAALLFVVFVLSILAALRTRQLINAHLAIDYEPSAMIPIVLAAFFMPLAVWRAEDRARRAYHWSMPVEAWSHTLLRVYGGWVWIMAAAAIYIVVIHLMGLAAGAITGEWPRYDAFWWEYLLAFTGVTVAYLLSSALVVGSAHPWRWVLGIGLALLGGAMISSGLHLPWLGRAINSMFRGYAGLKIALWGADDACADGVGQWAVATAFWLAIGALLVVYASRRHPER
ncbi:MAG: hypothetical protein ACHQWU_04095 [Gemmatimonadales bacterium]